MALIQQQQNKQQKTKEEKNEKRRRRNEEEKGEEVWSWSSSSIKLYSIINIERRRAIDKIIIAIEKLIIRY